LAFIKKALVTDITNKNERLTIPTIFNKFDFAKLTPSTKTQIEIGTMKLKFLSSHMGLNKNEIIPNMIIGNITKAIAILRTFLLIRLMCSSIANTNPVINWSDCWPE
jgi:hypothetical protein